MRILVVHRAIVFADAVVRHLTGVEGVARVEAAYSAEHCAERIRREQFDVILFPRECLEDSARLRRTGRVTSDLRRKRVLVAPEVTPTIVAESIVGGMDAVISINQSPADMVQQLVDVVAGRLHLSNHPFAAHLTGAVDDPPALRTIAYHDAADIEIVRLIAAGLSDKEISHLVHYSGQTVRNRISRMLQDSNIANRTQLATAFLRNET